MFGHVLDHIFFSSKRSHTSQLAWFVFWTGAVVLSFWWFKDLALGVHGPINDHKGWQWRSTWNVRGI
jgi:dolichyl-phosphate-mannose-protein mannosyltransferase